MVVSVVINISVTNLRCCRLAHEDTCLLRFLMAPSTSVLSTSWKSMSMLVHLCYGNWYQDVSQLKVKETRLCICITPVSLMHSC